DLKARYRDDRLRVWTHAQTATFLAMLNGGDTPAAAGVGGGLRSTFTGMFLLNPRPAPTPPGWQPTPTQATGLQLMNMHLFQQDDAPFYLPLIAIRAARRAIHAKPADPYAHLALGEAYRRLSGATRERLATTGQRMPYLKRIRQIQAIT